MASPLTPPASDARRRAVRNLDAGALLESFLVAAVVAILVIRAFLHVTGYPKLGGAGLHIAHMLWGGLGMLVALVLLLGFLGKAVQWVGALVGGVGFGTFIDELGKFLTHDNDYFFRPTIALIYAIFVLLFLAFRAIGRQARPSPEEYLANALETLREALLDRADPAKAARARAPLERADAADPVARAIARVLQPSEAVPPGPPRRRRSTRLRVWYRKLVARPGFRRVVVAFFVVEALAFVARALILVVADPRFTPADYAIGVEDIGEFAATAVGSSLIVVGVVRLRWSPVAAYQWFRRATLVSIFLAQFFAFYTLQLLAVGGLVVDLLVLAALDYMIRAAERPAAVVT